jgi:hypothetical protein
MELNEYLMLVQDIVWLEGGRSGEGIKDRASRVLSDGEGQVMA